MATTMEQGGASNQLVGGMDTGLQEEEVQPGWWERMKRVPGLGLLLILMCVLLGQTTNVIVKKTPVPPLVLLLWRDGLRLATVDAPLLTATNKHPFPVGSRAILLLRGLAVGTQMAIQFHTVRILPLADYTMISSIKPVFVTLLSCIFLKEPCGWFEVANLLLVLGGVTLVLQPPIIFGATGEEEYTVEMVVAAAMLVGGMAVGSVVPVVLRHQRSLHWAAMASSARLVYMPAFLPVVALLGHLCMPACEDRLTVMVVNFTGFAVQTGYILSYKVEEAHLVGLVDNAANIIVSFAFQAAFFAHPAGALKVPYCTICGSK